MNPLVRLILVRFFSVLFQAHNIMYFGVNRGFVSIHDFNRGEHAIGRVLRLVIDEVLDSMAVVVLMKIHVVSMLDPMFGQLMHFFYELFLIFDQKRKFFFQFADNGTGRLNRLNQLFDCGIRIDLNQFRFRPFVRMHV